MGLTAEAAPLTPPVIRRAASCAPGGGRSRRRSAAELPLERMAMLAWFSIVGGWGRGAAALIKQAYEAPIRIAALGSATETYEPTESRS